MDLKIILSLGYFKNSKIRFWLTALFNIRIMISMHGWQNHPVNNIVIGVYL